MAKRPLYYPGLDDPRAALEELRTAYEYARSLERRFAMQSPWRAVFAAIPDAMLKAAAEATNDPCFFGGKPCGQSAYQPPACKPLPGR